MRRLFSESFKRTIVFKKLVLILAVSLIFLGCATAGEMRSSSSTQEQSSIQLEETTWNLVSFGLTRMAVPKNASITFKDGHYSGRGGCNGVGGDYSLEGDKIKLSAGFSTMMACDELNLEHKYINALSEVDSYVIVGDMLDLYGKGRTRLRFKAE